MFHGLWNHDDQVEQVAVKMLHDGATEKDKIKLLKEAAIIEQFAHNNIVKLCGVVISQDPVSVCQIKFFVSQLQIMVYAMLAYMYIVLCLC